MQLFNTLTWLYRVSKLCFPEFVHQFIDQKRSKMTKKWTKTIKNDLTSHTQLHEPVRSFYLLTHIFGTIRDCTHDGNAAILECLSIGMKKDTRRERKNVTAVLNFYFFILKIWTKIHRIYRVQSLSISNVSMDHCFRHDLRLYIRRQLCNVWVNDSKKSKS